MPVTFGVAGVGGYGGGVCETLLAESHRSQPGARLHAVCEPFPQKAAERIDHLRQHGVKVLSTYEQLLQEPVEALWLPLPIHLHCSFTVQALRKGKAVICEKPAAGCIDDVDAMIAAQRQSGLKVAIGFQDIFSPSTLAIKRRMLAGRIGRATGATLVVCWPRGDEYYARNAWAGALQRDGAWVLDSPLNNAAAHYLNLALFLLGGQEQSSAEPRSLQVELYRARNIENYDTISMRLSVNGGGGEIPLTVLMTHACRKTIHPRTRITGSEGVVDIRYGEGAEIHGGAGRSEIFQLERDNRPHMIRSFAAWMRGRPLDGAIATLETARQHALAVSGASEASVVHDLAPQFVETVTSDSRQAVRAIRGIEEIFQRCEADAALLSECGLAQWAQRPGFKDLRGYHHFAGPKRSA